MQNVQAHIYIVHYNNMYMIFSLRPSFKSFAYHSKLRNFPFAVCLSSNKLCKRQTNKFVIRIFDIHWICRQIKQYTRTSAIVSLNDGVRKKSEKKRNETKQNAIRTRIISIHSTDANVAKNLFAANFQTHQVGSSIFTIFIMQSTAKPVIQEKLCVCTKKKCLCCAFRVTIFGIGAVM